MVSSHRLHVVIYVSSFVCQTDQDTYAVFDGLNTLSPQKLEECGGSGKQSSYFTLNILYLVMTFRVVVNGAQKRLDFVSPPAYKDFTS